MIKHFFLAGALSIILSGCTTDEKQKSANADAREMTQYQKDERNKAIVLKCIRAYAANDTAYILAQNANDVVNVYSDQPPTNGIDSARIALREGLNLIREYKPSHQVAVADNNYVFVFQYIDLSFKKNEDTWHAKQVEIFKFNDEGKIILHTGVNETLEPNAVRIPF